MCSWPRTRSNAGAIAGVTGVSPSAYIFDPVLHFLRLKDGCKQLQEAHPFSYSMFVLLSKDDAGVLNPGGGKLNKIGVIGAEDKAMPRCSFEVVEVIITQQAKVAYGDSLKTPALQLDGDRYRDILI